MHIQNQPTSADLESLRLKHLKEQTNLPGQLQWMF